MEGSNEYANVLVYIRPHAFVLSTQTGVGGWNMMTGNHVKHININTGLKRIKSNGSEVILSTVYCRCDRCGMR